MSEMSKSQVIQSLYTIRAGLAQVITTKDHVEDLKKQRQEKYDTRQQQEKEYKQAELAYTDALRKYKKLKNQWNSEEDLEKYILEVEEQEEKVSKFKNKRIKEIERRETLKKFSPVVKWIVRILCLVPFIWVEFISGLTLEEVGMAKGILIIVSTIAFALFGWFFLSVYISKQVGRIKINKKTEYVSEPKKSSFALQRDLERLKEGPPKESKKLIKYRKILATPEDYTAIDTEIEAGTEGSFAICACLENTYSPLLDVRDWGNIDLLIYYLETNRADNIKEALHCLDEQLRHTELMTLMAVATKEICSRINSWGSRMSFQLDNIAANQQNLIAGIGNVNANLGNLLSATNLQNALLEKQNVTSQQLMQDVEALRSHSDYLRYKNARF